MRIHRHAPVWLLFLLLACPAPLAAADWPQWRGPALNGTSPETALPLHWSHTNGVLWTFPLPGMSGATPAIAGEAVFVVSPNAARELVLFCLDRHTGREKWQRKIAEGDRDKGRNNMASPSPITDGKTVWVMFATGDLAAFDLEGKQLWKRQLADDYGKFSYLWIYGASPLLYRDRLYIPVLQRSPVPPDYAHAQDGKPERDSYLLCLDARTGTNLWRHIRATDAKQESMESYTTPIPLEKDGQILLLGGNYLTAHDWKTGEETWRCGGLNPRGDGWWRIVPTPVTDGDRVFMCAPKRDPVFAVKTGGRGDVTATHVAWSFKEYPSDCVTPALYRGRLFVLDGDRQVMTCLDPASGRKLWQGNLGVREIFRASPTAADGRLYCVSESGTVVILGAGDQFEILATISMAEPPVRSSIAVAGGRLFLRTGKALYCIGPAAGQ